MAKDKTTEMNSRVQDFINAVKDEIKRKDSCTLIELLKTQTDLSLNSAIVPA